MEICFNILLENESLIMLFKINKFLIISKVSSTSFDLDFIQSNKIKFYTQIRSVIEIENF